MLIRESPFIANFVAGEFFVAVNIGSNKSYLYKIRNTGGTGQNMFLGTKYYLIGYQRFYSKIETIEYAQDMTMIGFNDGRFAKIYGTGGSGANMFNITETSAGFKRSSTNWSNYLSGSHKFRHAVIDISYIGGKTLVSFKNGKILKVNGVGGSGYNLFAISETNTAFSGVTGYNYYVGYQKLDSNVTDVTVRGSYTFIAFRDGRHIKVNGTGGSGANMFAIIKTNYGYKTVPGYSYLVGSSIFSSCILKGFVVGGVTFFSLKDGRMMKINGAGGSGERMFNIKETSGGFTTYSTQYTVYLLGDYKFKGYVIDMDYIDGNLILADYHGYVLKILNVGGTGHNMFNITYSKRGGYSISSTSYVSYLMGVQNMDNSNHKITQIAEVDGYIFVSYKDPGAVAERLMIKLSGTGSGSFENMFGLKVKLNGECYEAAALSVPPVPTVFEGCQSFPKNYS